MEAQTLIPSCCDNNRLQPAVLAEASHAGITVESCVEVLTALEVAMFGCTLAPRSARQAAHHSAIVDAAKNRHLLITK